MNRRTTRPRLIAILLVLASTPLVALACQSPATPRESSYGATYATASAFVPLDDDATARELGLVVPCEAAEPRVLAPSTPGAPGPGTRLRADTRPLVTALDLWADHTRDRWTLADDSKLLRAALAEGVEPALAIVAVIARSPGIRSATARVRAVEAEHGQLDALRRTLSIYESFVADLNLRIRGAARAAVDARAFPLPGADGLRARLIDLAVEVAREQLWLTIRREVRAARMTLARGWYLQEQIASLADQLTLLETARAAADARFAVPTAGGSLAALLRVDERIARLQTKQLVATSALHAARQTFAEQLSLHDPAIGPFLAPGPTPPAGVNSVLATLTPSTAGTPETSELTALPAAWVRRVADAPAVRMRDAQADRVATMVELLESMSRPTVDLGLSRLVRPLTSVAGFPDRPRSQPAAPWFGMSESYRVELLHREQGLRAGRDAAVRTAHAATHAATAGLRRAADNRTLAEDRLVDLAARYRDASLASLATGAGTIETLLDALRATLTADLDAAAARRDLHLALADLDLQLGAAD